MLVGAAYWGVGGRQGGQGSADGGHFSSENAVSKVRTVNKKQNCLFKLWFRLHKHFCWNKLFFNRKREIKFKRKLSLRILKTNLKKRKFSFSNTRWQGGGSVPHPGHRREPAIQLIKYNLQGGVNSNQYFSAVDIITN